MGKIRRWPDHHHHHAAIRPSPCTRHTPTSHKLIWVPAIPSWEKEFCCKIGQFEWGNFVEAKKLTEFNPKIFDWNDSAAEEAFRTAKDRFFAQIHGLPPNPPQHSGFVPTPDLYIDDINWDNNNNDNDNDKDNYPNLDGLKDEIIRGKDNCNESNCIRIEDIGPTGWDVDLAEISGGKVLTGLIVGPG